MEPEEAAAEIMQAMESDELLFHIVVGWVRKR